MTGVFDILQLYRDSAKIQRPLFTKCVALICTGFLLQGCQSKPQETYFSKLSHNNWEIYKATVGAPAENLTRYPANERFPDVSNITGDVVFSSDRKGSFNLYLMNREGRNLRPVSHSPFPDVSARWSPDGQSLVFVSERHERNENLYLLKPYTSQEPQRLTHHRAADYEPAWHPAGKLLVFLSERDERPEVYTLNLANEKMAQLTRNGFPKHAPAFSSDGKTLAYAQQEGQQWKLVWGTLAELQQNTARSSQAFDGVITDIKWLDAETLSYTNINRNTTASLTFNIQTRQKTVYLEAVRERVQHLR